MTTDDTARPAGWQEPSTESVPPAPERSLNTWIAVYEKDSGRLESIGTVVAGKSMLEPRGLAAKWIKYNPQESAPGGGSYEWDEELRDFQVVSLADGLRRSAAALRSHADDLDAQAAAHEAAAAKQAAAQPPVA